MTRFAYRAYDAGGALRRGEIRADSEAAALAALAAAGTYPVEIGAADAAGGAAPRWWEIELLATRRLPGERLGMLMRDLATLVGASIPLEEALRVTLEQHRRAGPVRALLARLHAGVREGAALSEAMSAEPALPGFIAELARAGERSGRLGAVLGEVATLLEVQARRRAELVKALIYPAVLVAAALATLAVVATVLVPTLLPLFQEAGAAPPPVLSLIAAAVAFGGAHGWLLSAAAATAILGAVAAARTEPGREARDRLVLALPGVSGIVSRAQTARLARTLATLTGNGVPLLEAVAVAAGTLDNRVFRRAAVGVGQALAGGASLSRALGDTMLIEEAHVSLVAIGERSGRLDAMLLRIATICEDDVARRLDRVLALLPPLLTLLIGGAVAALMLSVMGAISSLNEVVLR